MEGMLTWYAQRKSNTFSVLILNESFFKLFSDYIQNYTRGTRVSERLQKLLAVAMSLLTLHILNPFLLFTKYKRHYLFHLGTIIRSIKHNETLSIRFLSHAITK
jgi:hypothetical protein